MSLHGALSAVGTVLLILGGCALLGIFITAMEGHAPAWLFLVVVIFGIAGAVLVGGFSGASA